MLCCAQPSQGQRLAHLLEPSVPARARPARRHCRCLPRQPCKTTRGFMKGSRCAGCKGARQALCRGCSLTACGFRTGSRALPTQLPCPRQSRWPAGTSSPCWEARVGQQPWAEAGAPAGWPALPWQRPASAAAAATATRTPACACAKSAGPAPGKFGSAPGCRGGRVGEALHEKHLASLLNAVLGHDCGAHQSRQRSCYDAREGICSSRARPAVWLAFSHAPLHTGTGVRAPDSEALGREGSSKPPAGWSRSGRGGRCVWPGCPPSQQSLQSGG